MSCDPEKNPYLLPIEYKVSHATGSSVDKKKRKVKDEDKTVTHLCKKFAAMCEDSSDLALSLNVKSVKESSLSVEIAFASQSTLPMEEN